MNNWNFFIYSENDKKSGGESPARRKVKTKKSPKHSSSDQNSDSEAEEDSRAKATRPARGKAAAKKKANATKKKDAEEGEIFTQFFANFSQFWSIENVQNSRFDNFWVSDIWIWNNFST